jgi:hypothetical protein
MFRVRLGPEMEVTTSQSQRAANVVEFPAVSVDTTVITATPQERKRR